MATNYARQKAAQAWDHPSTRHMGMNVVLAEAFAEIIDEIIRNVADDTALRQLAKLEEHAEARLDETAEQQWIARLKETGTTPSERTEEGK